MRSVTWISWCFSIALQKYYCVPMYIVHEYILYLALWISDESHTVYNELPM